MAKRELDGLHKGRRKGDLAEKFRLSMYNHPLGTLKEKKIHQKHLKTMFMSLDDAKISKVVNFYKATNLRLYYGDASMQV